MTHSVTQNTPNREDWIQQLKDIITDPIELLQLLGLSDNADLLNGISAKKLFALRVPRAYLTRIKQGDANDPLLLQVITQQEEFIKDPHYSCNPLDEQTNAIPGLLHKYHNRALLLVKGACAINCRYCFRRHFPYQDNPGNKNTWLNAINYINQHKELDEILFSGGDPLMAKDHELDWLISQLEAIPHLKRLRIHSRMATVLPARITTTLCNRLNTSRLQVILVTHINHANEIDDCVKQAMQDLSLANVTLLNQSVLLKGINDNADILADLSNALFDSGILPYYLHTLDKVSGASHFMVDDHQAQQIMQQLLTKVSGYLVPRLVREISGQPSKTPLDLHLIK